jgi:hypothetical protein
MDLAKLIRLGVLVACIAALAVPKAVSAVPTLTSVSKSATPSKHLIQFTPGMQQVAFRTKNGMRKKQFVASMHLPPAKKKP